MKVFTLLILTIFSSILLAQNAEIEAIQLRYETVSKQIKACATATEEKPCSMYENVTEVNENKKLWPSLGKFTKRIEFWFLDNPTNCKGCADQGISSLQTVTVNEHYEDTEIRKEFVYNNGKLEFVFMQTKTIGRTRYERFYFDAEGALIRYADDANVFDGANAYSAALTDIIEESTRLQGAFLKSF